SSSQDLQQTPISITKPEGKTAIINCHVSSPDFRKVFIHWYQKKVDAVPKRVAYMSSTFFLENQSDKGKFTVKKDPSKSVFILTVSKVTPQDSATYYCANGQAQVLLEQREVSITSGHKTNIHWYRHTPTKAPERILNIGAGAVAYDDSSYSSKYSSSKKGTNVCTLTINDINSEDEGVDTQSVPGQTPELQARMTGTSASMSCKMGSRDIVHWYKQLPGEQPKRIVYETGGTPTFDDGRDRNRMQVRRSKITVERGFQESRYMVEGNSFQKQCILTIKDVIPDDAATYYCAYWDPHCTKLVVSEKESSPPANSEILQKKHENQTTYVCLIEKFYPDVIRVTWTDDEKEVTDNVVKGDTWQSTKEDEYSIASWLTVPAENENKNYYCKYEHENKKASLPTQDFMKTASQEEDCRTVFNRDQLMHRTAYLVYIILLLKSSMYYLIVLFFIYKMWASTKYQGKKA
ncbi:hypothetical protein IHE44_0000560, partial [Lamprotornis superbus]